MGMFFVDFVVGMASATGLEGVTPSTGTMILEAIRTIKITRPNRTKKRWCGVTTIIGTGLLDSAMAGAAGLSFTWMLAFVSMIEPTIAEMAPIRFVQEAAQTITTIVMTITLEEYNLMRCLRSPINHKKWCAPTDDFQLVLWGEDTLKGLQFFQPAWSFRDTCQTMKVAGHGRLSGSSVTEGAVGTGTHGTWIVPVTPGPHGDDGSCTAKVVFVLYGDDTLFHTIIASHGLAAYGQTFPVTATGCGHPYDDDIQLEATVWVKCFVGV